MEFKIYKHESLKSRLGIVGEITHTCFSEFIREHFNEAITIMAVATDTYPYLHFLTNIRSKSEIGEMGEVTDTFYPQTSYLESFPTNPISSLDFSPDGNHLVVGLNISPFLMVYDISLVKHIISEFNSEGFVKSYNLYRFHVKPTTKSIDYMPSSEVFSIKFSGDSKTLVLNYIDSFNDSHVTIYLVGTSFNRWFGISRNGAGAQEVSVNSSGSYVVASRGSSPFLDVCKKEGNSYTILPIVGTPPPSRGNSIDITSQGNYIALTHNYGSPMTLYKRIGDSIIRLANPSGLPNQLGKKVKFIKDGEYVVLTHASAPYISSFKVEYDTLIPQEELIDEPVAGKPNDMDVSPNLKYMVYAQTQPSDLIIYKLGIEEQNDLDIKFKVPYGEGKSYQAAIADIPHRTDVFSSVVIEQAKFDGLQGQGYNPHKNYFNAIASVPDSNILDVKFSTLMPPIHEIYSEVVKDTYVRESRPTENFGRQETMVSGVAGDGRYISYIEIPLEQIIEDVVEADNTIVSIDLILSKLESTSGVLDIHEVYSSWGEYYLLYITPMEVSIEPIASIDTTGHTVRIDVQESILRAIDEGKTSISFALKSSNIIIMNTRESGNAPKLLTRYIEPEWEGNIDRTFMFSSAIIRRDSYYDFNSSFSLLQKLHIESQGYFKRPEDIFSSVNINQPSLFCSVNIVGSKYLLNSVMIRQKGFTDLVSGVDHNDINKVSTANIPYRNDILSAARVASEPIGDDLLTRVHIARDFVFGLAELVLIKDLTSEVIIRRKDNLDLASFAETMNFLLNNTAQLKRIIDITSGAVIRERFDGGDLVSKSDLSKFELTSNYNLRKSIYLTSEATIRIQRFDRMDLVGISKSFINGEVQIRRTDNLDLISEANLFFSSNLKSEVGIRRFDSISLTSEGIVRRSAHIDSLSEVRIAKYWHDRFDQALVSKSFINGEVQIRRTDNLDLNSNIYVPYYDDLKSEVGIRRFDSISLTSEGIIRRSAHIDSLSEVRIAKYWHDRFDQALLSKSFINGEVQIRRTDNLDLNSNIYVPYYDDLKSEVGIRRFDSISLTSEGIIRRSAYSDLLSSLGVYKQISLSSEVDIFKSLFLNAEAIRRQSAVSDSGWEAFVTNGWYHNYFFSAAYIRQRYSHLPCFAVVNTPARIWVPNPNRRLPRLWVRENFIQE